MLGDSDQAGWRRLYFNAELDYFAEFRTDDVLGTESVAEDQAPFVGEPATRVTLRRDAEIRFTYVRTARPMDEFDLDTRLGAVRPDPRGPTTEHENFLSYEYGCQYM